MKKFITVLIIISILTFTAFADGESIFEKQNSYNNEFHDISENDWFYSDVTWATKEKLFVGTDEGKFLPHRNLTWEHITIVLERTGHKVNNVHGKKDITRGEFAKLLYEILADKSISYDAIFCSAFSFIGNVAENAASALFVVRTVVFSSVS